jgi:hypothetical protein
VCHRVDVDRVSGCSEDVAHASGPPVPRSSALRIRSLTRRVHVRPASPLLKRIVRPVSTQVIQMSCADGREAPQ